MTDEQTLDNIEERAHKLKLSTPHPFLKWAGSKRYLLKHIVGSLPQSFNTYREPFLGGGSLFFFLKPELAVLSDTNEDLINTYAAIRDNASSVFNYISPLKSNKTTYYKIREKRSKGKFKRAAEFIYINKTCWNGLYRVNSKGIFNVPYGSPKNNYIADIDNLRECSKLLNKEAIELRMCDFEEALAETKQGDLVYLDPPYVTGHSNNGFVEYNEKIFSWSDQLRLAKVAMQLASIGAHVVVSNANHNQVLELYKGFNKMQINRNSTLAGDINKRGKVSEVLLVSSNKQHNK